MEHAVRPTVLIVDDDDDLRASLEDILSVEGYVCTAAPSADAALDELRAAADVPSVILLDLVMPGMLASAFVATLTAFPQWASIPVLLVTASTRVPKGLAVQGVLLKPFDVQGLLDRIHELISSPPGLGPHPDIP